MAEDASTRAALLDRAEQAHKAGHFAEVQALLKQLAREGGLSSDEEKRAQALRNRLRPDPFVAMLIAACLVLFIAVVASHWH
jgi:hypothetical protein